MHERRENKTASKTVLMTRADQALGTDASPSAARSHHDLRRFAVLSSADRDVSAYGVARPNRTGLPDRLKAGLEAMSGIAMDDVRVHRNSAEPTQLHARAFARGRDIHLAPGEDRHLPHEAWHVVQQKQGRVAPTTRMGQAFVNDDPALEREADTMGRRALNHVGAAHASIASHGDRYNVSAAQLTPVAQRLLDPIDHPTTYDGPLTAQYASAVKSFVDDLNRRVDEAYNQAKRWRSLAGVPTARVKRWYDTAAAYSDNPMGKKPRIIYANFGYAIEELACQNLGVMHKGLTVQTQVVKGHSIPDVVLTAGGQDIAWLDITSIGSRNHIQGKMHSGWKSRPFIYEIVYPKLDLGDLLSATKDPYYSEYAKLIANHQKAIEEIKEERRTEIASRLLDLRDSKNWKTGTDNKVDKQKETADLLNELSEDYGSDVIFGRAQAKGALQSLEVVDGPFGFNGTNDGPTRIKSDSSGLKELVNKSTSDDVDAALRDVNTRHSKGVIDRLKRDIFTDRVEELEAEWNDNRAALSVADAAMALLGAQADYKKLHQMGFLVTMRDEPVFHGLWLDIIAAMEGPEEATSADIKAWRRHADVILHRYDSIEQALAVADDLAEKQPPLGGKDHFWVKELVRSLRNDYPPDADMLQDANEWLTEHAGAADGAEQGRRKRPRWNPDG